MPLLRDLHTWIRSYVRSNHLRITLTEINSIIAGVTGIPREHLLIHNDSVVPAGAFRKITRAVKKRGEHYPLQYLTGSVEFMGIKFRIRPGVLIPRPETELLAEICLQYTAARKNTSILDLCCGSGVIGLSIARLDLHTRISLSDRSLRAVNLARENAAVLGLAARTSFYHGDLFSPLPVGAKFDLIVSNPPYIPNTRMPHLQKEVRCEPVKALDGGKNGTEVITRIVRQAGNYLNDDGILAIEHDDTHQRFMESLGMSAKQTSLYYVKTINDLSGRPRVSIFRRVYKKDLNSPAAG